MIRTLWKWAQLFLRTSVDLSTRPALGFVLMNLLALACGIGFCFRWKRSQKKLVGHVLLLDAMVVVESDRAEQQMLQKHFGMDGSAGFYRIEKSGTSVRLKAE